jgi:hypothetical protein
VEVIEAFDFVEDSVMRGEIHHVTSRGEVRFVASCHMIVVLGILNRCRARLTAFLAL